VSIKSNFFKIKIGGGLAPTGDLVWGKTSPAPFCEN